MYRYGAKSHTAFAGMAALFQALDALGCVRVVRVGAPGTYLLKTPAEIAEVVDNL